LNIADNTILITGGSSGIGLALAGAFLKEGNRVIACGRNTERHRDAARKLPDLITIPCDISSAEDQDKLRDQLQEEYPELNILVNNAGIQHNYQLTDPQDYDEQIREEIATNFTAAVTLTNKLLPILLQQEQAAVINVTSSLAIVPKQSAAVYCATKAALRSFTHTLRYQLEHTGCQVIEVVPPLVDTAMTQGRGSDKISPQQLAREVLEGLRADQQEILVGKSKLLFLLHRLVPGAVAKLLRNS
jgi:short-subunit dehydrogenase involved in D-alanine esterification of teichoic acids